MPEGILGLVPRTARVDLGLSRKPHPYYNMFWGILPGRLLDGNSSRLKSWGYSAEIPAEKLKVFSRRREREKRAESNRRRAGETVRVACGRSKRLVGRERECPLGTICSKCVPEAARKALATSFTLRKNRPQLFLTPRVKRQCKECVLLFAGSGSTEGLYIPAVMRAVVGARSGCQGLGRKYRQRVFGRDTANSGALPNLSVASLADRPRGREAEMALE